MFVLILITFFLLYILQLYFVYCIARSTEISNLVKGVLVVPMIGLIMIVSSIVVFLISRIFRK